MAFQQLIAKKIKLSGLAGIQHHMLDRDKVKTNPDIDLSRSHLNYFIENLTAENLNSRVKSRIKQLNLKKRPRSDAVGLEDIVVKASADFMLNVDDETRENYFSDALHFFQHRYGKENVMYCHCHLDESSPHIHVGIVPITPDGRLSAKSLFSPKTLEQLQTDFHRVVSQHYGLERGQSHAKKYIPIQKFKAQQAKSRAEQFTKDLQTADFDSQKIRQATQSAHYATSGIVFTSKDKEHVQMPTQDFLLLKHFAEQGLKAVAQIDLLIDDIQKLQHDEAQSQSDLSFFLHQLSKLEKDTEKYSAVPKFWRKHIDDSIDFWEKTFTNYCHDVNRHILKVFIATHGDFCKTEKIMRPYILKTGVENIRKHIKNVIRAANHQIQKDIHPDTSSSSWEPPKTSETDYRQPDITQLVPPPSSAQLGCDDINWDMITWDLLSNIAKDELLHKLAMRDL